MKEIKQLSDQELKEAIKLGILNSSSLKVEELPAFNARMAELYAELHRRVKEPTKTGMFRFL